MKRVFADTFYFLALLNERDQAHGQAVTQAAAIEQLVTTEWVLIELADGLAESRQRHMFVAPKKGRAPGIWPVKLRERLPAVTVPLRAPDGDVHFDLQEVLHRIHDAAGYQDYIYTGTPQPPLSPADVVWAEALAPRP